MGVFGVCGEIGQFWSVWPGGEGEPTGEEEGSGTGRRDRTRELEVAGGLPARRWERRRKREDGRGAETGRSGKPDSRSERNNVKRAEEGDSRREGVRVFGQQPPGAWGLSSTRYILGSSFWAGGGYGSLVFRGYVLWGFSVIQWGWDLEGKDIITIFVQQS